MLTSPGNVEENGGAAEVVENAVHDPEPGRDSWALSIYLIVCMLGLPFSRGLGVKNKVLYGMLTSMHEIHAVPRTNCRRNPHDCSGWLRLDPLARFAPRGRPQQADFPLPVAAVGPRPLEHGEVPA